MKTPERSKFSHDLIHLFAYIVQADNVVTKEEIHFVNKFIIEHYAKDEADAVYDSFLKALDSRPTLEHILERVKDKYDDYQGKIGFIINLYELIAIDCVDEKEIRIFESICDLLHIEEEDVDLICSIFIEPYNYRFSSNINRKIELGNDIKSHDLIYQGIRASLFYIQDTLYVANIDSHERLYIDKEQLFRKSIRRLKQSDVIVFGSNKIAISDVPFFFKMKQQMVVMERSYKLDGERLVLIRDEDVADITVHVDRNIMRLYRKSAHGIKVNGIAVKDFDFIHISDKITFDDRFDIDARYFLAGQAEKDLVLADTTDVSCLLISNRNAAASFFIDDGSDSELEIRIQIEKRTKGYGFVLHAVKIPYRIMLDNNYISEGKEVVIERHSRLIIGQEQLIFDGSTGVIQRIPLRIMSLVVKNLTYKFGGVSAVDNISFSAQCGELNCIMGVAGSGKSTLLKLLLGFYKPLEGSVLVNGINLHENFNTLKKYIGYVPQDDLLYENLTAFENLYYAARLRSHSKSKSEVVRHVNNVLMDIGLYDKKDLRVGSVVDKVLSGGQRKRLNIGMELLGDPDIFFLDEPTSGLSSVDSENIINLLAQLAKRGKIIYVVIHQPSSDIYKVFHNILVLDNGGKMAFYGSTYDAVKYFKTFRPTRDDFVECPSCGNVNHELIFSVIEEKELGLDGRPVYIVEKTDLPWYLRILGRGKEIKVPKRLYDPDSWKRHFMAYMKMKEDSQKKGTWCTSADEANMIHLYMGKQGFVAKIKKSFKLFGTVFQRSFRDKLYDRFNLIMTFLVPMLLSCILSSVLKGGPAPYTFSTNDEFPKFLFLSSIVFIFMGVMAGINIFIKERPMMIRERTVDIKAWHFLTAKSAVFLVFSFVQVLIFASISFYIQKIPVLMPHGYHLIHNLMGNYFIYFLTVGLLTSYASFSIGIFVSSFLKSEYAALSFSIVLLIPQIIFGGLLVKYSSMPQIIGALIPASWEEKLGNSSVPFYCNIMVSRWSFEALLSGQILMNPYHKTQRGTLFAVDDKYSDELYKHFFRPLRYSPLKDIPEKIEKEIFEKRLENQITRENLSKADIEFINKLNELVPPSIEGDIYDRIVLGKRIILEKYYKQSERDKRNYYLQNGLTEVDKKNIATLFGIAKYNDSLCGEITFNSKFSEYMYNSTVYDMIRFADGFDDLWDRKINWAQRGILSVPWCEFIIGSNIFPAHDKFFGSWVFKTVYYNMMILAIIAAVFNFGTILRIRKLQM